MSCPTLIAETPTVARRETLVLHMPAHEVAWLTFGASLVEMHAEQEQARERDGATASERDIAGFAARGLELAVECWNDVTAAHRGTLGAWSHFSRLVAADIAGGYAAPVRDGLVLALAAMQNAQASYAGVTRA
jgi:hypothetical protein